MARRANVTSRWTIGPGFDHNGAMNRTITLCLLAALAFPKVASSADGLTPPKRLTRVPVTQAECEAAFAEAATHTALLVPAGRPLEVTEPRENLHFHEPPKFGRLRVAGPFVERLGVLAMGSEIAAVDQAKLPFFTGGMILESVRDYYMNVQVRLHRDDEGRPQLLDRAVVALAKYSHRGGAQASTECVDAALRDMRSLGIWHEATAGEHAFPSQTLVLLNRGAVVVPREGASELIQPQFEFILLQVTFPAKERPQARVFVTTHERTRLHSLASYSQPGKLSECAIQGSILFTEYGVGGQLPKQKATRSVVLKAQGAAEVTQLDECVGKQKLTGDTWANLPQVFDALASGAFPAAAP